MVVDKKILEKVEARARELTPQAITFLRDLVRIPSQSGNEKEVVARILEEMDKCHFDSSKIDEVGSVTGRVGTGAFHLWYDSHIDTVGIGERALWPYDPYEGKFENDIIYGRGASDNKAATATMVIAGQIISEMGLLNDTSLTVIGTVQEEDCDGLAMRIAIENSDVKPNCVVLGECTNLNIYRGHRGRIELKITVPGKSCHASAPERGINAVYRAAPIIQGIEALNEKLPTHEFLGKGSVALTQINSVSGSLNTVPEKCTLILDRRITFGETKQSVLAELRKIMPADDCTIEILPYQSTSYTGYKHNTEKYFPSWMLEENHPFVQAGVEAATLARGSKPEIGKWIFSTNGVSSMGMLGVPTIGFGPSEEKFAHSVDDQVSVEHLFRAILFYSLYPLFVNSED